MSIIETKIAKLREMADQCFDLGIGSEADAVCLRRAAEMLGIAMQRSAIYEASFIKDQDLKRAAVKVINGLI
jgi:hypothetical protein